MCSFQPKLELLWRVNLFFPALRTAPAPAWSGCQRVKFLFSPFSALALRSLRLCVIFSSYEFLALKNYLCQRLILRVRDA